MSDILERLHNCPNCAAALDDFGRCMHCGSKVYDFTGFDFDTYSQTYIRMKYRGKIVHFKAIPDHMKLSTYTNYSDILHDNNTYHMATIYDTKGSIDFQVIGDIIFEETENETD